MYLTCILHFQLKVYAGILISPRHRYVNNNCIHNGQPHEFLWHFPANVAL